MPADDFAPDQPEDWEPAGDCIYECGGCDLLFAQPDAMLMDGRVYWRCPECYGVEFYAIGEPVVATIFYGIVGQVFSEGEILMLRSIAFDNMGPIDPASRWN